MKRVPPNVGYIEYGIRLPDGITLPMRDLEDQRKAVAVFAATDATPVTPVVREVGPWTDMPAGEPQ